MRQKCAGAMQLRHNLAFVRSMHVPAFCRTRHERPDNSIVVHHETMGPLIYVESRVPGGRAICDSALPAGCAKARRACALLGAPSYSSAPLPSSAVPAARREGPFGRASQRCPPRGTAAWATHPCRICCDRLPTIKSERGILSESTYSPLVATNFACPCLRSAAVPFPSQSRSPASWRGARLRPNRK